MNSIQTKAKLNYKADNKLKKCAIQSRQLLKTILSQNEVNSIESSAIFNRMSKTTVIENFLETITQARLKRTFRMQNANM